MIFDGWCLDDDNSLLCDYGICHLSVIQLVLRLTAWEGPDDLPMEENSGMGDKTGKNLSMERLYNFETTGQCPTQDHSGVGVNSGNPFLFIYFYQFHVII